MLPIETDLTVIERLSIQRESENFAFRAFLKDFESARVDKIVRKLHRKVTAKIDCLECGNCCNQLTPRVREEEIKLLAGFDNADIETYTSLHLEKDAYDGSLYLKALPCRYLDEKACTVYENRPKECREYPYTHRKGFVFRTMNMIANYGICPIVFNVMENLKVKLWFKSNFK